VELMFVSSAKATIVKPVAGSGAATPGCPATFPAPGEALENPRSTGFHLRFGDFRFIDLGDLSGPPLYSLVCPVNLLGEIDAYLVPHHGGNDIADSSLVRALKPRVAIFNNGQTKGGGPLTFAMLHASALQDVWQLHRSSNEGVRNFADEHIANLDETTGHWIKLSAKTDGSFQMTNGRTGLTKSYPAGKSRAQ
jgi:competence protein ComEC